MRNFNLYLEAADLAWGPTVMRNDDRNVSHNAEYLKLKHAKKELYEKFGVPSVYRIDDTTLSLYINPNDHRHRGLGLTDIYNKVDISALTDDDWNELKSRVVFSKNGFPASIGELTKKALNVLTYEKYTSNVLLNIKKVEFDIINNSVTIFFSEVAPELNLGEQLIIEEVENIKELEVIYLKHLQEYGKMEENALLTKLDDGPIYDLNPIIDITLDIRRVSSVSIKRENDVILVQDGTEITYPFGSNTSAKKFRDFINLAMLKFSDSVNEMYKVDNYIGQRLDSMETRYNDKIDELDNFMKVMRSEFHKNMESVKARFDSMANDTNKNIIGLVKDTNKQLTELVEQSAKDLSKQNEEHIAKSLKRTNDSVNALTEQLEQINNLLKGTPNDLFE